MKHMNKITIKHSQKPFKKILIFAVILLSIYLVFSGYCIYNSVSNGLFISQELKNQYRNNLPKKENQHIIGIISPSRQGEMQQALMLQESAEKMGQLSYVFAMNDQDMKLFLPAKYINELIIKVMDYLFKTDFHLVMSFHVNISLSEPNIMYISVPKNYLLDGRLEKFSTVQNYNNFIDINLINTKKEMMGELLGKKVQSGYGLVGIPANEYKTSDRQKLIFFGSLWGRKSDELYGAIKELAKKDYMYFIKHPLVLLPSKYSQKFTELAPGLQNLQNTLNKYGIAVCVHSNYHIKAKIPSSRIFEIISSGAIAISDKNPFVMKYFGDNVLYFDQNLSKEEIFNQINDHVIWVQTHPKEAEEMARNAHKIIQDNFTTERFILDVIKFYEEKVFK